MEDPSLKRLHPTCYSMAGGLLVCECSEAAQRDTESREVAIPVQCGTKREMSLGKRNKSPAGQSWGGGKVLERFLHVSSGCNLRNLVTSCG